MKEPKNVDKRSKEYRTWKQWKKEFDKKNSIGLGDVVEKITEVTGVKKAVEAVTDDCGCNERKQKLNKLRFRFPVVRCFTEDQYNQWAKHRKLHVWTREQQINVLIPIYKQLFSRQLKPQSCCLDQFIKEIDKVYENA